MEPEGTQTESKASKRARALTKGGARFFWARVVLHHTSAQLRLLREYQLPFTRLHDAGGVGGGSSGSSVPCLRCAKPSAIR